MKHLFNLILDVLCASRRPAVPESWLSEGGAWLMGLDIIHLNDDAHLTFGKTATRKREPLKYLVAHHPAVHKTWDVRDTIDLINNPREDGHYYGYTFLIDVDGLIYQCAPLTKRTNHVKTKRKRTRLAPYVNNRNAVGVCFQHADKNPEMAPNEAQMAAGLSLHRALQDVFDRAMPVYGHGQLQTDRNSKEGLAFVIAALSNISAP